MNVTFYPVVEVAVVDVTVGEAVVGDAVVGFAVGDLVGVTVPAKRRRAEVEI